MSFWQELKRRNLFRVGAIYLAIAWLIIRIVSVVEEPLSLPDWFDTVVVLMVAAGFPGIPDRLRSRGSVPRNRRLERLLSTGWGRRLRVQVNQ